MGKRHQTDVDSEPAGESVSDSLREELEAQEPTDEKKHELREEHEGHLVRDTTSKLTVDSLDVGPGMVVEAKAEIPDTYCFTCEKWVGLSGVELRGTPRSRSDAYYLGGMPMDVLRAKNGATKTLNDLAEALIDRVEILEDREDAHEFIEATLEEIQSVHTKKDSDDFKR